MKNFGVIVSLILIIISIFIFQHFWYAQQNQTTFNDVLFMSNHLTQQLINNFFSDDETLKNEAELEIKKLVLKDLDYNNWMDYLDYIELTVYPLKTPDMDQEQLFIALNISKDIGVIGVYKPLNDHFVYTSSIEDLAYIKNIDLVTTPSTNRNFVIIEEFLDERLGSYFTDNYLRIFTYKNKRYEEVFRQSIDYEALYFEAWTDPDVEAPKWYKITEKNIIDYGIAENESIIINVLKDLGKFEASSTEDGTIPKNFSPLESKKFDILYIWDENFGFFIQNKGQIKANGEIVGIIEASEQSADNLLNLVDPYFKIVDKNGKIGYIKPEDLVVIDSYQ